MSETRKTSRKVAKVTTGRNYQKLRKDIRTWLMRVGVADSDITIITGEEGEGARVSYVFEGQTYSVISVSQEEITTNLAAVELVIHSRVLSIERKIETLEQAFAGYKQLPATAGSGKTAYDTLGLIEGADFEIVKAVYKRLVQTHHPDHGGNSERFRAINEAYEAIKNEQRVK